MRYNVTIVFTVEAASKTDAMSVGETVADHIADTCNDDDSISPEMSVSAELSSEQE